MSAIYENWERLVDAVLKKELLWQLFHADSVSPSFSSDSSGFSFSHLTSDVSFCFSDLEWYATDNFPPSTTSENVSTSENDENSTPSRRKRDLKIQVPESQAKWADDAKRPSYPLPLPPGAKSGAESSSHCRERTENVESPWKKGKLIGKGPIGDVFIGFNSEQGGMCAMKEMPLSSEGERERSSKLKENEIALLSCMSHPNIVRYFGSEMVANKFYIYYEYMSRGSILMILKQYGRLGESAIRNYTQQILSGLAYLHSKSITHGNIKAANILIDPKGSIKLTNFGIEKQIAAKLHTSWMMDNPYWMAPEVIINPDVSSLAIDIWSLGCTVLEMATSKPPLSHYDGVHDLARFRPMHFFHIKKKMMLNLSMSAMAMFRVAYHKELPAIPPHLSADCKDFVRQCLQWNPMHRATASQLLEHPFVKCSLPLDEKIPSVTMTFVKIQDTNVHQLDSGKVVSSSLKASKSGFGPRSSPLLLPTHLSPVTPTSELDPTSPLYHPRSPQPATSTLSSANGAIQLPQLYQPTIHQENFRGFPKQSTNNNSSPSYWDPNILRGMFRFS